MAKITEITPKVERVFTLELSETELRSINIAMGITNHADRSVEASRKRVLILGPTPFYQIYANIGRILDADNN
jgi:hypothetical protein